MGRRPLLRKARRAQALAGVLIAAGILGGLAALLAGLGIEAQRAESTARAQLTGQAIAELAINSGMRVLRDTVNGAFVPNLKTVQDSRAQGWVTNSGSPCTWSGIVAQIGDMFYHVSPLIPGTVPYQVQTPSPQAQSSFISLWGTSQGPGGQTYTWQVTVGLRAVPSPCPTWQDNGVTRAMTFPVGAFAFAWVWDPEGALVGEMSGYTPPETPGVITLTYQDCPAYFSSPACHLPVSVQVMIPPSVLLWNDPNVSVPPQP